MIRAIAVSVLTTFTGVANAMLINGDFEAGDLSGWTVSSLAVFYNFPGDLNGSGEAFTLATGGLTVANLNSFFGLGSNAIQSATSDCSGKLCFAGDGLFQTTSVSAGDLLTFDWSAPSIENSSSYADAVFFVADNAVNVLAQGDGNATGSFSAGGSVSYVLQNSGVQTIGFGWINGGDGCCGGGFSVDNVVAADAVVPVPATLTLMGLGLAGLGWRHRKVG